MGGKNGTRKDKNGETFYIFTADATCFAPGVAPAGAGDPAAAITEISDNSWSGGEKIIPLSSAKAREWAEEHLDADEYAEIFGMPDEGEDVAALNIQIDAALMARLRARAADEGISLTACVEGILRDSLN